MREIRRLRRNAGLKKRPSEPLFVCGMKSKALGEQGSGNRIQDKTNGTTKTIVTILKKFSCPRIFFSFPATVDARRKRSDKPVQVPFVALPLADRTGVQRLLDL